MTQRYVDLYLERPIIVLPETTSHLSVMYEMRSIYGRQFKEPFRCADVVTTAEATVTATATVATEFEAELRDVNTQAPVPEYGALEARQEKILGQLADLKQQVVMLCQFLKQSANTGIQKNIPHVQKPVVLELVLNVNPKKPPYSILALQKIWTDTSIRVSPYIHSTIYHDQVPLFYTKLGNSSGNVINLSLIWKKVEDLEVVSGVKSYPIKGEVNFLRYLSRLIKSHNYEHSCLHPHTLDFALDLIDSLHNEENAERIEKELIVLANKFEKWSSKKEFNIVDIALWSLIKQFPKMNLPSALYKWYDSCEKAFIDEKLHYDNYIN
ncbi:aminoacyl tRNA synthase complex-interacting multifunctional protein 2 isoform X2 [Pogonomyrmex barbatus]|uniref:Aminoacyl tRNA synthase complex-interacting multifunctional protein 2 isoform X2 n=1 Tax=Pogonomyrmex barbatus TaxID=144034 RepID=A0A6I9WRP4_9HYME|nr:aminoacyl tRNA synthase complex-interacting multifunctional protein 2 isoform X2 [Pogonomyrmex barbatus]